MHGLAILAANHAALTPGRSLGPLPQVGWGSLGGVAVGMVLACVGFAAVSARRLRNRSLAPVGSGAVAASRARRLTRVRLRIDGMLTGMLSDEADRRTHTPAGRRSPGWSAAVPDQRFEAPSTWRGAYVDALPVRRHVSHPYPVSRAADAPAGEFRRHPDAQAQRRKAAELVGRRTRASGC